MALVIVDIASLDERRLGAAARILRESLPSPTAYKGLGEAEAEVAEVIADPGRFGLAAVDGERVLGWIGAVRGYSHSLELHPLVVDPRSRVMASAARSSRRSNPAPDQKGI